MNKDVEKKILELLSRQSELIAKQNLIIKGLIINSMKNGNVDEELLDEYTQCEIETNSIFSKELSLVKKINK